MPVITNNPNLHHPYLEGGPFLWQAGPTGVLLVHGYTATTAEVRPLGRILHNHGYTVAGPLLPGHGASPEEANCYRWQDWVAAVESAYQQLQGVCQRIILGGESTGAVIALYMAADHPEAQGILAYAPALKLNLNRWDVFRLHLLAPFVTAMPKARLDADSLWQGYRVNPLKGAIQLLHMQNQVRKRLPLLRQPLLVMQGRLDTTVSPQAPQTVYDCVSSSLKELHWMEQSSHCVILDCELERAADLTLRFLKKIELETD